MVVLDDKSKYHQSYSTSSWGERECLHQISSQSMLRHFTKKHKCHGGTRGKVRCLPKSLGLIVWAPLMSLSNVMAIQPVVAETKVVKHSHPWSHVASGYKCKQTVTCVHSSLPLLHSNTSNDTNWSRFYRLLFTFSESETALMLSSFYI